MAKTRAQYIAEMGAGFIGHLGNISPAKSKIKELAGLAFDAVKYKGTGTAAEVAAVEDMVNGDSYRIITTAGDLNTGDDAITTLVGDVVIYNQVTDLWEFLVSGAAINV